jgi:hypothetical protein
VVFFFLCGTSADPAIHCIDEVPRFGDTNLKQSGMDGFFKSHVCNDICRALRLTMPPPSPSPAGGGAGRGK